MYLADIKLSNI